MEHIFSQNRLFKYFLCLVLVAVTVFADLNYFELNSAQASPNTTTTNEPNPPTKNPRQGLVTEAAIANHIAASYTSDADIAQAISGNTNTLSYPESSPNFLPPTLPIPESTTLNRGGLSRDESVSQRLIRIDSRSPNIIFNEGFVPRGNGTTGNNRLHDHVSGGNESSNFVSASYHDEDTLKKSNTLLKKIVQEQNKTYVYEIYAPGGIDITVSLEGVDGVYCNMDNQREVSFFGGIQSRYIRSAREYEDSRPTGYVIENTAFDPYLRDSYGQILSNQNINLPEIALPEIGTDINPPVLINLASWLLIFFSCNLSSNPSPKSFSDSANTCSTDFIDWTEVRGKNPESFNSQTITFGSDTFRHPNGTFRFLDKAGKNAKLNEFRVRSPISMEAVSSSSVLEDWAISYDSSVQSYFISSALHNGLMLEMDSAGRVFAGNDNQSLAQRWHIQRDTTNPDLMVISNHQYTNFKLLSDGENMFGSSNLNLVHGWNLVDVEVPFRDGTYFIESVANKNHAMQYDPGFREIETKSWNKNKHQEFSFNYDVKRDAYRISHREVIANNDYLAIKLGGSVEGDINFVRKDDADDKQFWKMFLDSNGSYVISNYKYSHMVLSLGQNVLLAQPFVEYNENQQWRLHHYQLHTLKEGNYVFRSSLSKTRVVDYATNAARVNVWDRTGGNNQHWYVAYDYDKQAYSLASNEDRNMFLYWNVADNSLGVSNSDVGDYRFWRFDTSSDNKVVLRSYAQDRTKVITLDAVMEEKVVNGVGFKVDDFLFPVWESQTYSSSQRFMFESIDSLPHLLEDQLYSVTLDSCASQYEPNCVRVDNRFLSASGNSNGNFVQAQQDADEKNFAHDSRLVQFVYDQQHKAYRLRFPKLGKYITWYIPWFESDRVGLYSEAEDKKEQFWDVIENVNGGYLFINRYHPLSPLGAVNQDEIVNTGLLYMNDYETDFYTWNVRNVANIGGSVAESIHAVTELVHTKNNVNKGLPEFGLHAENDNGVVLGNFVGEDNQQWHFVGTHLLGVEHIVAKNNKQYLTWDNENNDGGLVVSSRDVTGKNQNWVREKVGQANNVFVVTNLDHPNLCLTRKNLQVSHQDSVRMEPCEFGHVQQQWFADVFYPEIGLPVPEIPVDVVPLDVSGLFAVENVQADVVDVAGGVGFVLDAENGRFVVETVDAQTVLSPIGEVNEMFGRSGLHTVTVYNNDYSFVRQYNSGGFDLSKVAERKQFYEQISVVEDDQFLVFRFAGSLSFVSVGGSVETSLENVTEYVVQRKGSFFVAWLPQDLVSDQPVLKKAINQSLGREVDSFVGKADLEKLTSLTVFGDVSSVGILEYATNLVYLDVHNTALNHLPHNIGNLSKLKELYLYRNSIVALPASFGGLVALEFLDLSDNQLVDIGLVGGLKNLQHLDVENNNIAQLPYLLKDLEKLTFLQFGNNNVINFGNLPKSLVEGEFAGWGQSYASDLQRGLTGSEVRGVVRFPMDSNGKIMLPEKADYQNGQCSVIDVGGFGQGVGFVVCSVDDFGEPISYQFEGEVFGGNFFQGTVSYNFVFPDEISHQSLGVVKVGDEVGVGLDKVVPNSFKVFGQLPDGLRLETENSQVFLRGKPSKVGVQQFSLEADFGGLWFVYNFSFEVVSQDTLLVNVGQKLDYREIFSKYVPGKLREYAVFGQHSGGLLPVGVEFGSVWLDKQCVHTGVLYTFCWGSSEISFVGYPLVAGTYQVQVVRRGVDYSLFGGKDFFYNFGEQVYNIRVL